MTAAAERWTCAQTFMYPILQNYLVYEVVTRLLADAPVGGPLCVLVGRSAIHSYVFVRGQKVTIVITAVDFNGGRPDPGGVGLDALGFDEAVFSTRSILSVSDDTWSFKQIEGEPIYLPIKDIRDSKSLRNSFLVLSDSDIENFREHIRSACLFFEVRANVDLRNSAAESFRRSLSQSPRVYSSHSHRAFGAWPDGDRGGYYRSLNGDEFGNDADEAAIGKLSLANMMIKIDGGNSLFLPRTSRELN